MKQKKYNFIVNLGRRGSGKTEFCKRIIRFQTPIRCLVLDVNGEYQELPEATEEFINQPHQKGIYKATFYDVPYASKLNRYIDFVSRFKNGLLICEEPCSHKYEFSMTALLQRSDFVAAIVAHRLKSTSIILNIQYMTHFCNPKIVSNADMTIVHRTELVDSFEKYLPKTTFSRIKRAHEALDTFYLEYMIIQN